MADLFDGDDLMHYQTQGDELDLSWRVPLKLQHELGGTLTWFMRVDLGQKIWLECNYEDLI